LTSIVILFLAFMSQSEAVLCRQYYEMLQSSLCLNPFDVGLVDRYAYPIGPFGSEETEIGCFTEESLAESVLTGVLTFFCRDWSHLCSHCGLPTWEEPGPCLDVQGTFNRYLNTGPNPPTCFYAYGKKRSIGEDEEVLMDYEIARENCLTCPDNIVIQNMQTVFLHNKTVINAWWFNPELLENEPDDLVSLTTNLFEICTGYTYGKDGGLGSGHPTNTTPMPLPNPPEVPNPPEPEPEVPNPPEPEPEPEVPNPPEPEPEVPNPPEPEPEVPNPPEPEPEVPNPPEPEPEVPYPQPQS